MNRGARINPHHDLLNVAHYHCEIVRRKMSDPEAEAIALDCFSCLLALAIGVEAILNFAGNILIESWKERQPYKTKLQLVVAALNEEGLSEGTEPLVSLSQLKSFRDLAAHAKPIFRPGEPRSIVEVKKMMSNDWDELLEPAIVLNAYQQVCVFEGMVYENEKVKEYGILTQFGNVGAAEA